MDKLVNNLKEALKAAGIKDGATLSFHHHMRNGDYVLNMTLAAAAELGVKDLTVNASAIFPVHAPLIDLIKQGVVTGLECNYMSGPVGEAISQGILDTPVIFRTHGGRPADIASGQSPIDIAVIAAPAADKMGNISGKFGPSQCGSLGYAFADAEFADQVIAVTDHLMPYPLVEYSIPETQVNYVVQVDKIGDPKGIVSGTTKITRDPIGLLMAQYATQVIEASPYYQDGMSFQTGAGGASLATAAFLKDRMLERGIKGSYGMGGITSYLVDMLEAGCFESLVDVQCFDLGAVESIRTNPKHREVSALHYAAPRPAVASSLVDNLDFVILGATEMDKNFNVNVHTNSQGVIMGGSGGHSDTAAGAKLAMIIAPLTRARMPLILDQVTCLSTPGETIDILVTQYGIAVNPRREDLIQALSATKLPLRSIEDLQKEAEQLVGKPQPLPHGDKVVGQVRYRTGEIISEIYQLN